MHVTLNSLTIYELGSTVAVTNTFPTGFPKHRLAISSVHNKPIEHVTS